MNNSTDQIFDKLTTLKTHDFARLFSEYAGVFRSSIEKYSDRTHFIYELLQNADDAFATEIVFLLTDKGLWFKHNGTERFSLSDPDDPTTIGHINSITSIGASTKIKNARLKSSTLSTKDIFLGKIVENNESIEDLGLSQKIDDDGEELHQIGKFGIGFKSVFAYTDQPFIYDDYHFCIKNFIIPIRFDPKECPPLIERSANETLFYFPFNQSKIQSCQEIKQALERLYYPLIHIFHLKKITCYFENIQASSRFAFYEKTQIEKNQIEKNQNPQIKVSSISYQTIINQNQKVEYFLNYQQKIRIATIPTPQSISISFPYAEDQKQLISDQKYQSFCFFDIKDSINLGFMIHAPFLLVDNRESLLLNDRNGLNQALMSNLAELLHFSLLDLAQQNLIDDHIIEILYFDQSKQSQVKQKLYLLYEPIFRKILATFLSEKIIPCRNQCYYSKDQVYWALDSGMIDLFADDQLAMLFVKEIAFGFISKPSELTKASDPSLYRYMQNLFSCEIDYDQIAQKITPRFMAQQSNHWLIRFYQYIHKGSIRFREALIKNRSLYVPNQYRQMICLSPQGKIHINDYVFLPSENRVYMNINFVDEEIANACRDFFKEIGIRYFNQDDQYLLDLDDFSKNHDEKFKTKINDYFDFIKMTLGMINQANSVMLDKIYEKFKVLPFIKCKSKHELLYPNDNIFLPNLLVNQYFHYLSVRDVLVVDLSFYEKYLNPKELALFEKLLSNVGVKSIPAISGQTIYFEEESYEALKKSFDLNERSLKKDQDQEYIYDLFSLEFLDFSQDRFPKPLTEFLIEILDIHLQNHKDALYSKLKYFPKNAASGIEKTFDGTLIRCLRRVKWLFDIDSNPISPDDIVSTGIQLHPSINLPSRVAEILFSGKTINRPHSFPSLMENLMGIYGKHQFLKELEKYLNQQKNKESESSSNTNKSKTLEDHFDPNLMLEDIEEKKQELERIQRLKELSLILENQSLKYQYIWFLAMLEKEIELKDHKVKTKSIKLKLKFFKVELEPHQILVLSRCNSDYLDVSLEEAKSLRLVLEYDISTKGKKEFLSTNVLVDVAQVEESRIKVKITKLDFDGTVEDIPFHKVKARLEVSEINFLKNRLLSAFKALKYQSKKMPDDFNLQTSLPPDLLKFVFGPPGTGKTTHLSKEIVNMMDLPKEEGQRGKKILVLAPTNQAADVLAERILSIKADAKKWLLRLGISISQTLLSENVVIDNTYPIQKRYPFDLSLVTTIARFPYENFRPGTTDEIDLKYLEWDVVIFDEASMITLAEIIYVIYYLTERSREENRSIQFIIAGDPFQIAPVTLVQEAQDENIYKIVELNSFKAPTTLPHPYHVERLMTQYRSVPTIGRLFSEYRYQGEIKHHRAQSSLIPFHAKHFSKPFSSIQTIYFDVKRDPIYRIRRLNDSPYQIYSGLFTVEFAMHLYREIQQQNLRLKIGVICPYHAQAKMIEKTLAVYQTDIIVGTVHRFQGDECDIIIAVFNPPNHVTSQSFLNNKNILNVAISRAKNYLFMIRPSEDFDQSQYLSELNLIHSLVSEDDKQDFDADAIEKELLNDARFIEKSTFVTTHQNVNVYSHLINKYEVRAETHSLDIQLKLSPDELPKNQETRLADDDEDDF